MSRHVVRRGGEARFVEGEGGLSVWSVVDETAPAVHTGFELCALEPGGSVPPRVQSFEESVYVTEGELVLRTPEGAVLLGPGDYGLLPVGYPHAWRNDGDAVARWARMLAPQPRQRFGGDTVPVPLDDLGPPQRIDVRDPRTRLFGHIEPANMDPGKQSQELLALSASMRTALLVYSGITVKMMVDSDLGALLATMFMVQYEPAGVAGPHDHPFEEAYYFLEGVGEGTFDGETYQLEPGDVAFAGVGCVHGFRNLGDGPLRWLETQAPQPPGRHSYRFVRDWDYLKVALEGS
ncbi:MAG TPA: cupin domain-containing protein [Actinophytocola sp.]|uniref:cupin domain-containing protein n=1 Tax=Actinophytocola sp. TaxID=1872138 RepID=UPI002DB60D26|nr:cupin domain-containing protein [Actinophytocola sp.]HEU5472273.1 cupin domain-containing protein [Actinophytocola sp.]